MSTDMSADASSAAATPSPYQVMVDASLPDAVQTTINTHLALLPVDCARLEAHSDDVNHIESAPILRGLVDGRGLACPMPLLKTKVALRSIAAGESLYVLATDPNSRADIHAFCQQTHKTGGADALQLMVNQATDAPDRPDSSAQVSDTIFHFIITKTDSN